MKKAATSLIALLALALTSFAGDQDFRLVNRTGFTIYSVYVSPSGEDSWQEDVLQDDTLASGSALKIRFSKAETTEFWDLRIKSQGGDKYSFYHIDLLKVSSIVLTYDSDTEKVTADYQ